MKPTTLIRSTPSTRLCATITTSCLENVQRYERSSGVARMWAVKKNLRNAFGLAIDRFHFFLIVVVPISKNPTVKKKKIQFSQCVANIDPTQVSRYPAPGSNSGERETERWSSFFSQCVPRTACAWHV
jgi:hypothetical protein